MQIKNYIQKWLYFILFYFVLKPQKIERLHVSMEKVPAQGQIWVAVSQ